MINKNRRNFLRIAFLGIGVLVADKALAAADTIRISKSRIDMGEKEIRNIGKLSVVNRMKVPVGTNLFD